MNFANDDTKKALRNGVIGENITFFTAFGQRKLTYADWTASARGLQQVEDFILRDVLPYYGNTHTTSSMTGCATTASRESARGVIKKSINCNSEDAVIFCGSGSTAAINKFVQLIQLQERCAAASIFDCPVVFVGPYEHHSNLLPWRESGALVVEIGEDCETGGIDLVHLEHQLKANKNRSFLVGSFSAGSNVTGVLTDVDSVCKLLRQYGALVCFDYAGVAPYVPIDMNPSDDPCLQKDAIFISPHKFIGGVGATGLLIAKKRALVRHTPTSSGGGTVLFVTDHTHAYLENVEEREEGGTPDIIGCIRAGLVFTIKEQYGVEAIEHREQMLVNKVKTALAGHPNVVVLGHPLESEAVKKVPILSFLIRCGTRFLHHNFVSALLNDLYGIQSRSGCMCAGPYVIRLFGLDHSDADHLSHALHHWTYLKPGFTRLSLVYFMEDTECDYILQAILDLAEHAWKLLPQYVFNSQNDSWKHKLSESDPHPSLSDRSFHLLPLPPQPAQGEEFEGRSPHAVSPPAVSSTSRAINSSIERGLETGKWDTYYRAMLDGAMEVYENCMADYLVPDSIYANNEDYESELYATDKAEYSWFVFPKDIFQVICAEAIHDRKLSVMDLPYDKNVFLRPEVYVDNLKSSVSKRCDITHSGENEPSRASEGTSTSDGKSNRFTEFLAHLIPHHRR